MNKTFHKQYSIDMKVWEKKRTNMMMNESGKKTHNMESPTM